MKKAPTIPCGGRVPAIRKPLLVRRARQAGLGAIAALFVLVMLSALAAAVVRLGWSSQVGTAQDILGARATQAANAGIQWGLFQVFRGGWSACAGSPQTLNLRADTGFMVTVSCSMTTYNEGESAEGSPQGITLYTVDAVACNGAAASCPDNATAGSLGYVERRRLIQATN